MLFYQAAGHALKVRHWVFEWNCGTNLVGKHAETRVEYRFKNPYAEMKCTDLLPLATTWHCTHLHPIATTCHCILWPLENALGPPKKRNVHFGCGCIYGHQEMHKRMLQSVPCLFSLPISLFVAFWYVWLAQFVFHVFGYLDAIFLVLKNA